jgi:hypothetical protein
MPFVYSRVVLQYNTRHIYTYTKSKKKKLIPLVRRGIFFGFANSGFNIFRRENKTRPWRPDHFTVLLTLVTNPSISLESRRR